MDVFLPKGTRDYLPETFAARSAVIQTIRDAFLRHGFHGLDTPAFERIETLEGRYGEEGRKLIFRILERGEGGTAGRADLALRYDLTVPLARVVAMNADLRLPWRRHHIAPVWRADRPAKGRFREFLQCDCDVVGAPQGIADAECLAVAFAALDAIALPDAVCRINDRRLLRALAAAVGAIGEEGALLVAVDKLDKIGRDGVSKELAARGFADSAIAELWRLSDLSAPTRDGLRAWSSALIERVPDMANSIAEARDGLLGLWDDAAALGVAEVRMAFDATLARGLDYYTGPVWEFVIDAHQIGTIASGGRYDGLVGMFSGRDVPAVGVSLGLERLLVVLEALGRLPTSPAGAEVVVAVAEERGRRHALAAAAHLRAAGIPTEVYAGTAKLKAQFRHADALGASHVVVVGGQEVDSNTVTVKNLARGEQVTVALGDLASTIRRASVAAPG